MYYTVENASYWYEIKGEGIPIVLLHGFTGSSTSWEELIANYPNKFQWITIDLPGHGKTQTDNLKTMDECCNDIHELMKSLNIESFFLLGYSMGGRTALNYARLYPKSLQGLILESASPGLKMSEEREARRVQDAKLVDRIKEEGLENFIDFWQDLPLFSSQKLLSIQKQTKIRESRMNSSPEGLISSLIGMGTGAQQSNWENLNTLTFPVLLLLGALDEKFVKINKQMQTELPNATLHEFADTGHTIHVENSGTYGKIVTRFIEQHGIR